MDEIKDQYFIREMREANKDLSSIIYSSSFA